MNNNLRSLIICIFIAGWWLGRPAMVAAEFYRYVDQQGRIFYVDDLGKVPEAYHDQIQIYREKYDYLPEQDRSQARQKEREQLQRIEQEKQLQINEQLQELQQTEEMERKKQAQEAEQRLMEKMQTRVVVDGNRILVPVTLENNGIEMVVDLLLDTGASQVVLHREVAEQLNMIALKKGLAQVAGGRNIYVETGEISSFKVGPFHMQKARVMVINHEGEAVSYSGLLGMNFLKSVPYTIDYQNQVIRWQLPQQESAGNSGVGN